MGNTDHFVQYYPTEEITIDFELLDWSKFIFDKTLNVLLDEAVASGDLAVNPLIVVAVFSASTLYTEWKKKEFHD